MKERPGGFLIARHWIIVNGRPIYEGEDWGKAGELFRECVQTPAIGQVTHEVQKRLVPRDAPPDRAGWEQGTPI